MSENARVFRVDRFQDLLSNDQDSERFVRQGLQFLEDDFRTMALLALSDWQRLEIVQPEMFHAVAALQRPSWGMWNGLLTALKNSRKGILRGADEDLRQKVEGAELLDTILKQLNLRLDTDIRDSLKPLSGMCNSPLPNKLRLGAVLTLPISLRNRIAHDAPSDGDWWKQAADAVRPLVDFHTHLSPLALLLSDECEYPAPWFLVGDDGSIRAFNGLERDQAVNYAGIDGSPVSVPERVHSVLLAFQSLLGKSDARETDFRKLLSKLAPDEIKGVMLGGLLVGRPVGAGGFATVHLGRQLATGRRVAVKILHDGQGERSRERFQQEARFLSRMDHPHVVDVYGYGEDTWSAPRSISLSDEKWFQEFSKSAPVRSYIALEWIDGRTLDDVFKDRDGALHQPPTLSGATPTTQNLSTTTVPEGNSVPDETNAGPQVVAPRLRKSERYRVLARWFSESASALSAVHNSGLVHRDIKPSNLMVDSEGSVHLMDFGIARTQERERTLKTTTGSALGTPAYMAPEQLRASSEEEVGPAADVYALSATFYELFTGTRLFNHDTSTLEVVATKKLQGDRPRRPRRFARGLPWELEAILLGGLEPNVRDRYASMEALRLDIENFLVDQPIAYRRPGLLRRMLLGYRRNRTLTNVVMFFVLLTAGGLYQYVDSVIKSAAREHELLVQRENQLRIATSTGLAAKAVASKKEDPILGLLLARESAHALISERNDDASPEAPITRKNILPVAYQALIESVANVGGTPLPGHEAVITDVKVSSNNRWLASCAADGSVRVTDLFSIFPVTADKAGQFAPLTTLPDSPEVPDEQSLPEGGATQEGELAPAPGLTQLPGLATVASPLESPVQDPTEGREVPDDAVNETGSGADRAQFFSAIMHTHEDECLCLVFDPYGRFMVTGGRDGSIIVWEHGDADGNGEIDILHRLPRGSSAVNQLAFGPNLQTPVLASGSADGQVRLWNLSEPEEEPHLLTPFKPEGNFPTAGTPSPISCLVCTENIIVSVDTRYRCQVWFDKDQPAKNLSLVKSVGAEGRYLTVPGRQTAAVSANFRWMFVGSGYWGSSAKPGEAPKEYGFGSDDPAYCGAFSADSEWLATARGDGSILVQPLGADEDSFRKPNTLVGHDGVVDAISFAPQTPYSIPWLATAGEDRSIRVWDLGNRSAASMVLRGHARAVRHLWFGCVARRFPFNDQSTGKDVWPGPAVIISGSDDGTLRAWDVSEVVQGSQFSPARSVGPAPKTFSSRKTLTTSVSRDRSRIAMGLWSGSSAMLTLGKDGSPVDWRMFGWHDASPVRSLAISPDGKWLLLTGNALYDTSIKDMYHAGEGRRASYQHQQTPDAFCWNPDSRTFFTIAGGTVRQWRRPTPEENREVTPEATYAVRKDFESPEAEFPAPTQPVTAMARHGGSDMLYCGLESGELAVIDLTSPVVSASAVPIDAHRDAVTSLEFDSKNRRLLTTGRDSFAIVWDVIDPESPKKLQTLNGHTGAVRSAAFSPDGRYVVTGSDDTTVRIWNLQATDAARRCTVVRGHARAVSGVSFSQSGDQLISSSEDGTVRIWDLRVDKLIQYCDELAGRDLTTEERGLYLNASQADDPEAETVWSTVTNWLR